MPADESTTESMRPDGHSSLGPAHGADLRPGDRVGHYKILERLGEGGFAIVYLAEQEQPIRRRVALKIIKLGMDTKQVIARFKAERQALALMDHPNVAKVFDAGATETGRPYFVMEYVVGTPITEYCDRQRVSIEERLHLFVQICEAVQHAHQKGIIHRDIKPSNVLASVKESQPLVKVIDFGVAKAISHRLTEQTIYTEQGQLIGTPEYMSPEQAEMTAENIDTRSDIYSLGVLLYELLTGALPFDPKILRRAAFGEIQRIIREQEPPKPSTRLSSLGDTSTSHAHKRRADPKSLLRELRGDLDWIVMKALEKDRSRRYSAASALAADIDRHLRHEVVMAGRPDLVYRLQKGFARHRQLVRAAFALVFVLFIGLAAAAWQDHRYGMVQEVSARAISLLEFELAFRWVIFEPLLEEPPTNFEQLLEDPRFLRIAATWRRYWWEYRGNSDEEWFAFLTLSPGEIPDRADSSAVREYFNAMDPMQLKSRITLFVGALINRVHDGMRPLPFERHILDDRAHNLIAQVLKTQDPESTGDSWSSPVETDTLFAVRDTLGKQSTRYEPRESLLYGELLQRQFGVESKWMWKLLTRHSRWPLRFPAPALRYPSLVVTFMCVISAIAVGCVITLLEVRPRLVHIAVWSLLYTLLIVLALLLPGYVNLAFVNGTNLIAFGLIATLFVLGHVLEIKRRVGGLSRSVMWLPLLVAIVPPLVIWGYLLLFAL